MNKHELIGKVLRKHFYEYNLHMHREISLMDIHIFIDLINDECDKRDIK